MEELDFSHNVGFYEDKDAIESETEIIKWLEGKAVFFNDDEDEKSKHTALAQLLEETRNAFPFAQDDVILRIFKDMYGYED